MLMMDNPDGTKPAIPLTAIQDFRQVPQGASLFETKLKASFHFLGVCDNDCVFVEHEGTVSRYYLTKENIYKYNAGSPQRVVMELKRIVNGEELGTKGDYHAGVLYNFQVQWAESDANTAGGVLVSEIIEPISSEGWFSQAPGRKQELWIGIAPGWTLSDMIGISAAKTATSAATTESASATTQPSVSASSTTEGKAVLFQYFEYVSQDGKRKPIPNSGFLLTKVLKDGKLWVTREGKAKEPIAAGKADDKMYEVAIKF